MLCRCGSSYEGCSPTPNSQLALLVDYSYHGFITDRDGDTLELEADHRRHAEIENAIRDLKYGVGLNHLPSGCFPANAAWLAVQTMAHNLARWTTRLGLGEPVATTKTLRRRFFSLAGRLTRKARRLTPASPSGLALAKPVLQRPGQTARTATPFLTTPAAASDPSARLPNCLADLRQVSISASPAAIGTLISPVAWRQRPVKNHLRVPDTFGTRPHPSGSKPCPCSSHHSCLV